MFRFHFTGSDYGRVVLRPVNPLWELTLSLHVLANGSGRAELRDWRARTAQRVEGAGLGADVRQLIRLAPEAPYFPDFLTPQATTLDDGLRLVAATPRDVVQRDLARLEAVSTPPPLAEDLQRRGGPERLARLLRAYYAAAIEPVAQRIRSVAGADLGRRAAVLQAEGSFGVLQSFDPTVMRFDEPVLRVTCPAGEIRLTGQGLGLVPSYFCRRSPVTNVEHTGTPALVYQAGVERSGDRRPRDRALAALLGPTRSRILRRLDDPSTTTALAAELHLAPSTVSAHLGVLHECGLVVRHRHANRVLYGLSPSGLGLLDR